MTKITNGLAAILPGINAELAQYAQVKTPDRQAVLHSIYRIREKLFVAYLDFDQDRTIIDELKTIRLLVNEITNRSTGIFTRIFPSEADDSRKDFNKRIDIRIESLELYSSGKILMPKTKGEELKKFEGLNETQLLAHFEQNLVDAMRFFIMASGEDNLDYSWVHCYPKLYVNIYILLEKAAENGLLDLLEARQIVAASEPRISELYNPNLEGYRFANRLLLNSATPELRDLLQVHSNDEFGVEEADLKNLGISWHNFFVIVEYLRTGVLDYDNSFRFGFKAGLFYYLNCTEYKEALLNALSRFGLAESVLLDCVRHKHYGLYSVVKISPTIAVLALAYAYKRHDSNLIDGCLLALSNLEAGYGFSYSKGVCTLYITKKNLEEDDWKKIANVLKFLAVCLKCDLRFNVQRNHLDRICQLCQNKKDITITVPVGGSTESVLEAFPNARILQS